MFRANILGREIRFQNLLDEFKDLGVARHRSAFDAQSVDRAGAAFVASLALGQSEKVPGRSTSPSTAEAPASTDVAKCWRTRPGLPSLPLASSSESAPSRTPLALLREGFRWPPESGRYWD